MALPFTTMSTRLSELAAGSAAAPTAWPRFCSDAEVARWRIRLDAASGAERLRASVALAWHLRQRDTPAALQLVASAARALASKPSANPGLMARLALVRGEAHWLGAEVDPALQAIDEALSEFTSAGDPIGCSDAHWLRAWVAVEQGDLERRDRELEASGDFALQAGDPLRAELAQAALARSAVFRDLGAAIDRWGSRYLGRELDMEPSLAAWVADFCALVASKSQRMGSAVAYGIRMHQAALASGQLQRAITAATNIGFDLTRLNDHESALEWMQRGLDLARAKGWPASLAVCLSETAETQRQLGRLDAAQELLDESLQALEPLGPSRWRALAHNYLGDVALDRDDPGEALVQFDQLETLARALDQADLQAIAARGRAHALGGLSRVEEALAAAARALELSQQQRDAYNQIAALRVMADLQRRQPSGGNALDLLTEALAIAADIEGYTTPPDLLEEAAREHAERGDMAAAYRLLQAAIGAREQIYSEQATQRAVALQIRRETEAMRAEAEQQRQLAEAEARRSATLQEAKSTLERLGSIGQAITATLSMDALLELLARQIRELLAADSFGIYLLDEAGGSLSSALLVEQGRPLPPDRFALDSPTRHAARCARERSEIALQREAEDGDPSQVIGSLPTLSALFAPLLIGERLLGVMTVQSLRAGAYGERERLIFRSLAAYGAIALDNADAYRQLERAHGELGLLGELSAQLQACPGIDEAHACIGRFARRLFPGSRGALRVADAPGEAWRDVAAWGAADPPLLPTGASCAALRMCQPRWSAAADAAPCDQAACTVPTPGRACLPMLAEGAVFGLLAVEFGAALDSAGGDRRYPLAVALAEQSALALANLRLREALREQSIRDPLTATFNRRYLDETLLREIARCERSGATLAVAMIDVDHFKPFNDRHGHAAGDRVLAAVGRVLREVFRRSDIVCRYGGEEFAVLLPDVAEPAAMQRATDLLGAVRRLRLEWGGTPLEPVTVSIGLALFPRDGGSPAALLAAADAALYRAKQAGRDRLVTTCAPVA